MLSRLVITFLPRSKCLLISWLQSPSAVIFEPTKNKVNHCFPIYLPWSDGMDAMILVFWMLNFKPTFSLSSFTFIERFFSSSSLSAVRMIYRYIYNVYILRLHIPTFFTDAWSKMLQGCLGTWVSGACPWMCRHGAGYGCGMGDGDGRWGRAEVALSTEQQFFFCV